MSTAIFFCRGLFYNKFFVFTLKFLFFYSLHHATGSLPSPLNFAAQFVFYKNTLEVTKFDNLHTLFTSRTKFYSGAK